MHMLVQPKAAKAFLSDEILYDQGLLPRILVAYPKSLIGTCVAVDEKSPPWVEQAHGAYCRQVLTLLESWKTTIDGGEPELSRLVMAPGARKAWFSYYNEIEPQLSPGGRYAHVKSTARRSAEQAARIAAVITLVESPFQETIVADVMVSAIKLARWYLEEWVRLKEVAAIADEITDAEAIGEWAMKQKVGEYGLRTFTLNELTKYGPNHLRPKGGDVEKIRARRRAALNYLVDIGRLYVKGASVIAWRDGKSGVKIEFTVSSDQ
jgi:hypothetical protein